MDRVASKRVRCCAADSCSRKRQLYAPVTRDHAGAVTVHLADDHPGAADPDYRERRNAIAAAALAWEPGQPAPAIEYSEAEQEVWRTVCRELAPKHAELAVEEYLRGGRGARPAHRPDPRASTRSPSACAR